MVNEDQRRLRTAPFTVRRIVKWGECDPAGIVYTARFLDYAVEAADRWFAETIGVDWQTLNQEMHMGSPMVHASLDFMRPLRTGDSFDVSVMLDDIGRSSYRLGVAGRREDGQPCFRGTLVGALIDTRALRAIPIPEDFRRRMVAYQASCAEAAVD